MEEQNSTDRGRLLELVQWIQSVYPIWKLDNKWHSFIEGTTTAQLWWGGTLDPMATTNYTLVLVTPEGRREAIVSLSFNSIEFMTYQENLGDSSISEFVADFKRLAEEMILDKYLDHCEEEVIRVKARLEEMRTQAEGVEEETNIEDIPF